MHLSCKFKNYLIVEFSTEGGCYIYKEGSNSFDPNADFLDPSTNKGGLRERRKITRSPDIIHTPGWQSRAKDKLMGLMILPDVEILPKKITSNTSSCCGCTNYKCCTI